MDSRISLKLVIAYDGGNYLGWQKTKMGPSIEASLEKVLEQILQEKVLLSAASRTDAGVHALGQVVNLHFSKQVDLDRLKHSLNSMLPKDIVVISIDAVSTLFHPTLDAHSKEYHYLMTWDAIQLPKERHYQWHYPYPLNIQVMREVSKELIGTHDFAAFCNFKKNATYEHYVRTIFDIRIIEYAERQLRFEIVGNNFLYKMVRNLVGTLVYIGQGRLSADTLKNILINRDRTQAGITAPAHGLFLFKINY